MTRLCTTRRCHHLPGRLPVKGALSAAAATASRWSPGETITVAFLPGSDPALMEEAVRAAREWMLYASLRFAFVGPEATHAMVRVATAQDGSSWSLVGKACLLETDQSAATVNLGWPDDYPRTLHEFGHVLDLVHEDQLPNALVPWDPPKVYAYFGGPPNNWPRSEVDEQVLDVDREPLTNGGFDPTSIMAYPIPAELLRPGSQPIPGGTELSPGDKLFVGLIYPFAGPAQPVTDPTPSLPTPAPPTTLPPAVTPPSPGAPPVNPVLAALITILGHLPGDVSKEVDLVALTNAVVAAEVSDPTPLTFAHVLGVAARAVVKDAAVIFPDPIYRVIAVRLLTAIVGG